ncbi:hypothetical protein T265_00862 [Opisthorchis viverrini]|uniref:Uncharacterized protein n=1 Tax=Opisthorchis viverrini TaxID=6198 RepID=A0A075A1F5_OPIVI|nr:hypothetical protein T265_00862 [Opisthorchis viverrini]KER33161.1 hypothetical protein T265_00862 [Opisthorchis viverrini]
MTHLTKLIDAIWSKKNVPAWGMSTVIPIFKKGTRTLCENYSGISVLAVASKVLSGIVVRGLTEHRERRTLKTKLGSVLQEDASIKSSPSDRFRNSDTASSNQQWLFFVIWKLPLALWTAKHYDSVCGAEALYANSRGRVKVYGKLSPEFTTSSGARQGCPLSLFLFNFIIDTIMEDSLPASNACGVEVLPGPPLTDIEYADDIALLGSDPMAVDLFAELGNWLANVSSPYEETSSVRSWCGPDKHPHFQISLIFTGDSSEYFVYDILQLNVLHTGRLMFQLIRYSRYHSLGDLAVSQPSCFFLAVRHRTVATAEGYCASVAGT